MTNHLHVELPGDLSRYINARASAAQATPSDYISQLVRQDMEEQAVIAHVMEGVDDLRNGRFSGRSALDFKRNPSA